MASNLPGAGSLNAANQIYNRNSPDGLTLAMFASSAAMEPLLGNKAAQFDATKFSWIGSMSNDVAYCGVWPGAGIRTFNEMLTKEAIFGGGAPAAITYQHPMVLKNVLHANIKVIQGYAGTRDINLAMQRGEVHGTCGLFGSSIKSSFPEDVKVGRLKIVIQMGTRSRTSTARCRACSTTPRPTWTARCSTCISASCCSVARSLARPGFRLTASRRCATLCSRP